MSTPFPQRVTGLLRYLCQPFERANEDMALGYFRELLGDSFQRQSEARNADGYVAGSLVLELKGRTKDWLAGLFQALAYRNEGLDFAQVVVGAKSFLAVWQVSDIPEALREEIAAATGAPNQIGRDFARRYADKAAELLPLASWNGSDLFTPLFQSQTELSAERIAVFEQTLLRGRRVRQRVTLRNFANVLRQMVPYFDAGDPVKAVRAFYSMIYSWDASSSLQISNRALDQATLGGEIITNLRPATRPAFKDFVEARYVALEAGSGFDDFFARYDEALDAVDPEFRRRHGIYFTDLDLSKLSMWLAKREVPKLGQDYLVIDPACGSGNLVTNWRSPLELRHKVVSEIEPELLFAVEQRMKGDMWHDGRFTVVPSVSEHRGLNFLDKSAEEYLEELRAALFKKGHAPDKPLAILCNPPYRSDDDQGAGSPGYCVHPSITALTGLDASSERYCCFLAQMKLICQAAHASGLPGDSLLLLFTKSAWLTDRAIFRQIRREMVRTFEDVSGVLVDGSEFFDVKGRWPVAFTIWRYKGNQTSLDADRPIKVTDLTWLRRRDLASIPWGDPDAADAVCRTLLNDTRSKRVSLGERRRSMRVWSGQAMTDFKRDRRKVELGQDSAGGLPSKDHRRHNKKTYGERDGGFVGFMDDLTPCRIKRSTAGKPWFRLNSQFMDVKKNRCFSGPPTHWGYCAKDLESARRLFVWYGIARTFVHLPYPMWADAEDLWEPQIPIQLEARVFACAAAIVFAENECIETYFPANNPVSGAREVLVQNPLTPVNPDSFWSKTVRPSLNLSASPAGKALVQAVEEVFRTWLGYLGRRVEIPIGYEAPYHIDARPLTRTAGLVQIRDYAAHYDVAALKEKLSSLQTALRTAKQEFYDVLTAPSAVNYFGTPGEPQLNIPEGTDFERVLARRLALAGLLVKGLQDDRNLGRTKLAKLFYLAEMRADLQLQTNYAREAAGPLDQRALYHPKVGIEALAEKHRLFKPLPARRMTRYEPLSSLSGVDSLAKRHLGNGRHEITRLVNVCRPLSTEQAEIVATLYACWNDRMLDEEQPSDEEIIREFHDQWHPKKAGFPRKRLQLALAWMRDQQLVPLGRGAKTSLRPAKVIGDTVKE
jgi:hypothetical protein